MFRIQAFLNKINSQQAAEIVIPVATSTLIVTALRLIGGLQLLEWSALDFFFATRPPEPVDNRIVLVTYTEEDLQSYEESVISDRNLSNLLERINAQSPAVIGLDLYRDIKEESPQLSDEQNERAYQELQTIFRNTENLIGIQKVLPPLVRPPKVLQEAERVAAAEVVQDGDAFIRRGYFYPNIYDKQPELILPGLGITLAHEYLKATEGIVAVPNEENWLTLGDVVFESFEQNDGGYVGADDEGYQVLINWRQADFIEVSLTQVLSDQVAPDMFTNRIVLIGNLSSTGDRYYLPMSRWSGNPPQWFYGVEVHSQIASSILSAVLDGRPMIKVSPDWAEYGLIFLGALAITLVGQRYRSCIPIRLIAITTGGTIIIAVTLAATSYFALLGGWWIPTVPAIAATGLAWVVSVSCIYIYRLQQSLQDHKTYIADMAHVLNNQLNPLKGSIDASFDNNQIIQAWITDISNVLDEKLPTVHENLFLKKRWPVETLSNELSKSQKQFEKIKETIRDLLSVIKLEYDAPGLQRKETDVNQLVQEALKLVYYNKLNQIQPEIIESYETLKPILTIKASFGRTIINLIDNAYDALIDRQARLGDDYCPKITIATRNLRHFVEITIEDNGIGISRERQAKIFRPFATFKTGGTGLGLHLAQKVAEAHHGSLQVQSQVGKGSRFTLRLSNH